MKKVIASVLLALVLALLALPAQPALAIPTISVSPDRGAPGTRIYITGTGFTANATFYVYFARGTAFESSRNNTVSPSGTIYDTFPVPELPAGIYTVAAETSLLETSWTSFTIQSALVLNKASAYVGSAVIANGMGFKASSPVSLDFEGTAIGAPVSGTNGSFYGFTFTVPEATRGNHLIVGTDQASSFREQSSTANAVLTVLNSVSLTPPSGAAGTNVVVKGTGFLGGQPVTIRFDDTVLTTTPATVVSNSSGSFSANFVVPASSKRVHDIVATDQVNTSTASFTSVGSISVTPNSGNVGTLVTVKGSGFMGGKPISIKVDAAEAATTTSDPTGGFSVTFNVPVSATGSHTVTASDGTESAISSFATSASASISPTKGAIGSEVTVKGTGLAASRPVNISFANVAVKSAATDANGSLNDKFTVPRVASGEYPVKITDGVNVLNFNFAATASLTLNQTGGNVGSSLTVTGSGFGGTVTVKYDNTVVGTTAADTSGAFFATFSVPVSVRGNHTISASDGVNSIQSTYIVESTPPQAPVLDLPAKDSDAKDMTKFDWSDAPDPSQPVTYTLQVATGKDFASSSVVLERKGLSVSEYVVGKGEELKPAKKEAPYYWRAKAIDAASNESDWSAVSSFYISAFPDWVRNALIGLGALIVALLIFWLGRRTKRPV